MKELLCQLPDQGGLSRTVLADDADFLSAPDKKADIVGQNMISRPQLRKGQIQNNFPCRRSFLRCEPEEDLLLYLRQGGHLTGFPLESLAHGLYGVHLLLQKPSCTGILPRDGILGVLYALLDSAKFLHFFIVFLRSFLAWRV